MTKAIQEFESAKANEDQVRVSAVLNHMYHKLARLAEAAGVVLDKKLRAYLEALSVCNQLGRYPSMHKASQVEDLTAYVNNQELRAKLNRAIKIRYDKLEFEVSMPQTSESACNV